MERELGQQIESGHLFSFFNRRRDRVEVLYFVGDGLVIVYRKLEPGTFKTLAALVSEQDVGGGVELKPLARCGHLTCMQQGCDSSADREPLDRLTHVGCWTHGGGNSKKGSTRPVTRFCTKHWLPSPNCTMWEIAPQRVRTTRDWRCAKPNRGRS